MSRSKNEDPLKAFRWRVEVDGFQRAGFTEVSGLKKEVDVTEYNEGGTETAQKSPGRAKYPNISLKRGLIPNNAGANDFYDWANLVNTLGTQGNPGEYRRSVSIVLFDANNTEVLRYNVRESWPAIFEAFPDLNGGDSGNIVETLELVNEGWTKV